MGQNSKKNMNILEVFNGMNEKNGSTNVLNFLNPFCLNDFNMFYKEAVKGQRKYGRKIIFTFFCVQQNIQEFSTWLIDFLVWL